MKQIHKDIFLLFILVSCLMLSSCIVVNHVTAQPTVTPLYRDQTVGAYWDQYVKNGEKTLVQIQTNLNIHMWDNSPVWNATNDAERIGQVLGILREIENHLIEKTTDTSNWIPNARHLQGASLYLMKSENLPGHQNSGTSIHPGPIIWISPETQPPLLELVSGGIVICIRENDECIYHYFRADIDLTEKINQIANLMK